ncbi:dystrotelin [Amia ocellicauda]|uniref:dystrotelin n=1 Tax=Amia ocellicauda TaxID=2972642 RepID=UPI00346408BC
MDLDTIEGLNEVQHAVYRTAFKLHSLQKLCQLNLVDLLLLSPVLQDLRRKLGDDCRVSVPDVVQSLQLLFQRTREEKPGQVETGATDLTATLLFSLFDKNQTGFIPLRSMATALVVFSRDKLSAKYTGA